MLVNMGLTCDKQALEDLSVRYDTSVRNSVGSIVQFRFGDDGLDPVRLEGEAVPIDFSRSWRHIRASVPALNGRGLMPWEITELTASTLKEPRFNICLPAFLISVESYIRDKIVEPAIKLRTAYGLADGAQEPAKGKGKDLDQHCSREQ